MKKLLLAVLFLGAMLFISGCCTRTDAQGVTTKNLFNCMQAAQETVCNPSDAVKAIAQMAAPVIAGIVNTAIPGSQIYFNAQRALNVLSSIQKVGCTSLTGLNELISFLKSDVFTTALTKYQATNKLKAVSVNVGPLIDWGNTAK